MKKIVLILLILIVSVTAFAMRPVKRITFPKGATKVSVTGYLNGYKDSQVYLIKLRKGQTLKVDANKPVSLYITDPNGKDASDMDASCHSRQVVENTKAGDYKIKAVECGKADAWKGSFKLSVSVITPFASLPSDRELANLIQATTQDFASALEIEDFTNFRRDASTKLKRNFTAKRIKGAFQFFIDKKKSIVPVLHSTKEMMPSYSDKPLITIKKGDRVLTIKGIYDENKLVEFEYQYIEESNQWKLSFIQIYVKYLVGVDKT